MANSLWPYLVQANTIEDTAAKLATEYKAEEIAFFKAIVSFLPPFVFQLRIAAEHYTASLIVTTGRKDHARQRDELLR